MENEIWKYCDSSPQRNYEISNYGNFRSKTLINKKIIYLTGTIDFHGYKVVNINKKKKKIHILVALAFIGERPDDMIIDHIDGNKLNNNVENLRYCSQYDNMMNRCDSRKDLHHLNSKERRLHIGRESYHRKKNLC